MTEIFVNKDNGPVLTIVIDKTGKFIYNCKCIKSKENRTWICVPFILWDRRYFSIYKQGEINFCSFHFVAVLQRKGEKCFQ
jgi:hypothetical protein